MLDLYGTTRTPWEPAQILTATLLARIAANYLAGAAEKQAAWTVMKDLEHRASHEAKQTGIGQTKTRSE